MNFSYEQVRTVLEPFDVHDRSKHEAAEAALGWLNTSWASGDGIASALERAGVTVDPERASVLSVAESNTTITIELEIASR